MYVCMCVAGIGSILCISAPSAHKRARAQAKGGGREQRGKKKTKFHCRATLFGHVFCIVFWRIVYFIFRSLYTLQPPRETSILYDCPNGIVGSSSTNKCIKLFVPPDSTDLSSLSVNLPGTGMHAMISSYSTFSFSSGPVRSGPVRSVQGIQKDSVRQSEKLLE